MAQDEPNTNRFRKLRLDISKSRRSRTSPLQSLSDGRDGDDGGTQAKKSEEPNKEDGISEAIAEQPDGVADAKMVEGRSESVEAPLRTVDSAIGSVADGVQEDGKPGTDDLVQSFRNRRTSISFNSKVTLEGGAEHAIDSPLPKQDTSPPRARGRSILHEMASEKSEVHPSPHRTHSETSLYNYHPITGEPMNRRTRRYRSGEERHPLLQNTVDELAGDPEYGDNESVAPLKFMTGSVPDSPSAEMAGFLTSPVAVSSPVGFTPIEPPSRWPGSARSRSIRSGSSLGSLKRPSRRNTARSSSSSMSPAGAFLSQWSREDAAAATAEPDDEGQEIGDHSEYIIGRQIGFGGFSVVKEVFTLGDSGEKIVRAVKIVRKQVSGKSEAENDSLQAEFEHEVSIWRFLKHRYILPLIAVYDSPFATFCITRLNTGGTLFDLVRSRRKEAQRGLPSHLAKRYAYQLASAMRYLHEEVRVVHRDIKLENCLLDMSSPTAATEGGNVLLCDFGMADFIHNESRNSPSPEPHGAGYEMTSAHTRLMGPAETSTSVVGSLQYASPELIRSGVPLYDTKVDMWAYGVVVFALLVGDLPFTHAFQPKLLMMILRGEWDTEMLRQAPGVKADAGFPAVDVVQGCLEMDPDLRWSVSDVLEHEWLRGCEDLYEEKLNDSWA